MIEDQASYRAAEESNLQNNPFSLLLSFSLLTALKRMEYDPVNKEVNPSRYQLESDSEEDDQLPQQKNLDDQSPRHLERIKLELPVKSEGVDLSILLNQAGLSWSQSSALRNQPEHGRLLVDGIQVSVSKTFLDLHAFI